MSMLGFSGSTVLVTGASSGIGKAFAEALAASGANLILTARSADKLAELAAALEHDYAVRVQIFAMDLTHPEVPQKLFNAINDSGATVDLLINNAGFGKFTNFLDEDFRTYQDMLTLNINALVELTYLFIDGMLARGHGGIINVASIAAFQPLPYLSVYAASKSFVLSFTEGLVGEYQKRGITCLALCPGNTDTNFMRVANADTREMSFATAEDVAKAGLKAYLRRKSSFVPGTGNYLTSLLARILTRKGAIRIAANMLKKQVVTRPAAKVSKGGANAA